MKTIELNIQDAVYFADKQYEALKDETVQALATLEEGTGAGNDFLGWLDLPPRHLPNWWSVSRLRQRVSVRTAIMWFV